MLACTACLATQSLPLNSPTQLNPPGNSNIDYRFTAPAACAGAITVTALHPTTQQPASFSNWLLGGIMSSAEDKTRTVAAPGVAIESTTPWGYTATWSGT